MSKHYSDGRIDVTAFGELCSISLSPMTADVIVKDKNGYIIRDSQKERIENKKEIARLVEKHCPNNSLVKSLLSSYNLAVNNPGNELVYLLTEE